MVLITYSMITFFKEGNFADYLKYKTNAPILQVPCWTSLTRTM